MALINCSECGTEISDKAAACPKCGAPMHVKLVARVTPLNVATQKPSWIIRIGGGFIGLIVLACVLSTIFSPAKPEAQKPADASEENCAKDDLSCLGNKGVAAAGVYCAPQVEKLATHDVKWKDGMLETKFDHFRWKDKMNGVITYIGDKASFQNGFGAYTPVVYECDMLPDGKTIADVRVHEGHLP